MNVAIDVESSGHGHPVKVRMGAFKGSDLVLSWTSSFTLPVTADYTDPRDVVRTLAMELAAWALGAVPNTPQDRLPPWTQSTLGSQ